MSDAECAERIRLQYLGQLRQDGDLQAGLLHRIAADVAAHCGVSLLKAHRLAWGWTVAQAVEAFHRMCRREKIKLLFYEPVSQNGNSRSDGACAFTAVARARNR